MHVHIFSLSTRHHIEPLLAFLQENVLPRYGPREHEFICCGQGSEVTTAWPTTAPMRTARGFAPIYGLLRRHLTAGHRLVIHGLYDRTLALALFLLLRKRHGATWVIWGSDMYPFLRPYPPLPHQFVNMWLRRSVFRRMDRIAGIPGDYAILANDLPGQWKHSPLNFPLRLGYERYRELFRRSRQRSDNSLRIMLGNSASATNRHGSALKMLSRFSGEAIELVMPLSYAGTTQYVEAVIAEARRLFGDRLTVLDQVMPSDEYLRLLAHIDILVFNHKRQEGVGTINSALMLGKKVYLHSDVSTYAHLINLGVEVHDTATINDASFAEFARWDRKRVLENQKAVYAACGQEAVAEQYFSLFSAIDNDAPAIG
ncbi:TDP-N-acetylfucosamine:lipid II N-acetylfucosaminyltransferase [Pseudohaliea sp.]|uniref:TDP-N-acetylfucosamine:lipid II N-acetylfucosaminyltransferase n=1 Tax=Pseudohaliea sp. TaxID=2740289 RepID=UPI0032EBAD1C